MSTTYIPFAFYGAYFASEAQVQTFLAQHGADYDNDSLRSASSEDLGLQYIAKDDTYALGFPLQVGVSDETARQLWENRFGKNTDAQSHMAIASF